MAANEIADQVSLLRVLAPGSWKLRHGRAREKPDGCCTGSRIVR